MAAAFEERKFNDDLLVQEADRKLAARKYPSIAHVLDHPALRELFVQFDKPATRAKNTGITVICRRSALPCSVAVVTAAD